MSLKFPISLAGKRGGGFPQPLHWWDLDDDEVWSDDGTDSWDPMTGTVYNGGDVGILSNGGPDGQDVSSGYGRYRGIIKTDQVWNGSGNSISHFAWFRRTADRGAGQWISSWHGAGSGGIIPTTGTNMIWSLNISGATNGEIRHAIWDAAGNRSYFSRTNRITNNLWYHIGFTYDEVTQEHKLYLNGEVIASRIASNIGDLNTINPAHFAIGLLSSSLTSTGAFLQGQIGMMGVWDTVLTEEQIQVLVNAGLGAKYAELNSSTAPQTTTQDTVFYGSDGEPFWIARNTGVLGLASAYNAQVNNTYGVQISDLCTAIPALFLRNYTNMKGNLTIPDLVTTIGNYAFENCPFDGQLTLPDGLQSIGLNAFRGNAYTGDIVIPDSVTVIPASMLMSAGSGGNRLILGSQITSIGDQAFEYSKIGRIDLYTPVAPTYTYKTFRNMSQSDGELHVPSNAVGYDNVVPTYRTIVYDLPAQTYRKSLNDFTGYTNGSQTVSSSTVLSESFAAWKAYDNSSGTSWLTTGGLPNWMKIDFGSSVNISKIIYNVRNDGAGVQSPRNYIVESSDDDTNWTLRSTVTEAVRDSNSDITHEFDDQAGVARYWRITFTTHYGENRIGLEKLEWHGF